MATKSKTEIKEKPAQSRYFEAVGRRKTSIARVRIMKGDGRSVIVNQKPYNEYFKTLVLTKIVEEPLETLGLEKDYNVSAKINGGGIHSQAEALRHGISRALLKVDAEHRKPLKIRGFLKRDPRMKERRKFGLKKARKAPQWAKR